MSTRFFFFFASTPTFSGGGGLKDSPPIRRWRYGSIILHRSLSICCEFVISFSKQCVLPSVLNGVILYKSIKIFKSMTSHMDSADEE